MFMYTIYSVRDLRVKRHPRARVYIIWGKQIVINVCSTNVAMVIAKGS